MASVYIYKNKAMPGLVKIGWTRRNAKVRVKEQHEGLPYPHDVAHEFYFEEDKNARFAEQHVHKALNHCRIAKKEWFRTSLSEAESLVRRQWEISGDAEKVRLAQRKRIAAQELLRQQQQLKLVERSNVKALFAEEFIARGFSESSAAHSAEECVSKGYENTFAFSVLRNNNFEVVKARLSTEWIKFINLTNESHVVDERRRKLLENERIALEKIRRNKSIAIGFLLSIVLLLFFGFLFNRNKEQREQMALKVEADRVTKDREISRRQEELRLANQVNSLRIKNEQLEKVRQDASIYYGLMLKGILNHSSIVYSAELRKATNQHGIAYRHATNAAYFLMSNKLKNSAIDLPSYPVMKLQEGTLVSGGELAEINNFYINKAIHELNKVAGTYDFCRVNNIANCEVISGAVTDYLAKDPAQYFKVD
jgi:hypothetical protein